MCESNNMSNCPLFKRELQFKFVVIGDFGVGKTSIIKRYAEDTFSTTYKVTIGTDFALKRIEWDESTTINLQLWDISGYERFGSMTSVYYRYALAAAVVFDLTRPETFKSTEKWILDIRERISLPNGESIPVILLANKGDIALDNVPSILEEFCKRHKILAFFVTSAKENINLDIAMNRLIEHTLAKTTYIPSNNYNEVVKLEDIDKKVKPKRYCYWF